MLKSFDEISYAHLRSEQNILHFADDFFKLILLNERCLILLRILLNFVPKSPVASHQWRRQWFGATRRQVITKRIMHLIADGIWRHWATMSWILMYHSFRHGCHLAMNIIKHIIFLQYFATDGVESCLHHCVPRTPKVTAIASGSRARN